MKCPTCGGTGFDFRGFFAVFIISLIFAVAFINEYHGQNVEHLVPPWMAGLAASVVTAYFVTRNNNEKSQGPPPK